MGGHAKMRNCEFKNPGDGEHAQGLVSAIGVDLGAVADAGRGKLRVLDNKYAEQGTAFEKVQRYGRKRILP